MSDYIQMFLTILCSIIASSGFWAYIQKRFEKKDVRTKLVLGLAHDRIIWLGMQYIDRGWITEREYENLHDYLYIPYKDCGGNGTAEKIMKDVEKLDMKKESRKK